MAHISRTSIGDVKLGNNSFIIEIPQEIVDSIIDKIMGSDRQQLIAYSLVSRAFRFSSCRYLFASIEISFDKFVENRTRRLSRVLENNPRLLTYIRILTVSLSARPQPQAEGSLHRIQSNMASSFTTYESQKDMTPSNGNTRAIEIDPMEYLSWLLKTLASNLITLNVCGPPSGPQPRHDTSWTRFPVKIASLLLDIAHSSPHMKALKLADIVDVPISILSRKNGDTFHDLHLENTYFSTPEASEMIHPVRILIDNPPQINCQALCRLSLITMMIPRAEYFSPGITPFMEMFSPPDKPVIGINFKYDSFLLEIDEPCLKIQLGYGTESMLHNWKDFDPPSPCVSGVQYPLIDVVILIDSGIHASPGILALLGAMAMLLRYPLLPTTIQTIMITLYLRSRDVDLDSRTCNMHTGLPAPYTRRIPGFIDGMNSIDAVLCDSARFPRLEKVVINYMTEIRCADPTIYCDTSDYERRTFSRLPSRGVAVESYVFVWPTSRTSL